MSDFTKAQTEYYSDTTRERLARHEPSPICICEFCTDLYRDMDDEGIHDWRSCGCDKCAVIYAEYEREMGE